MPKAAQMYVFSLCSSTFTLLFSAFKYIGLLLPVFCPQGADIASATMILRRLSLLNYKNLPAAELLFSRKLNCFIGRNGAGKTNVLDAIYFLSLCRSMTTSADALAVRHDADIAVLQGEYEMETGDVEAIYVGMQRGQKKVVKRGAKAYKRISEHIGLLPVVVVSPVDGSLIAGGSDERRRFMDVVLSQTNRPYLEALQAYNKALQQRNALLKMDDPAPDGELLSLWEEEMARHGSVVYESRRAYVDEFVQEFSRIYSLLGQDGEQVGLSYVSHAQRGDLLDVIRRDRHKDLAVGYSLHGIHRDDLEMTLGGFALRSEGSQGQTKTFLIALKLAQFAFLRRTGSRTTPILLLDDIFDKLDATRVERIVRLVSTEGFGQIFVTDTNREHLDSILASMGGDYRLFHVDNGEVTA